MVRRAAHGARRRDRGLHDRRGGDAHRAAPQGAGLTDVDVLVAGGGIAGLTAAHALRRSGRSVAVCERRDREGMLSGPGGIFIQLNAMRVFQALGDGGLAARMYEVGGVVGSGGFYSRAGLPLYVNRPAFADADDLGVCIARPDLQRILSEGLPESVLRCEAGVVGVEELPGGGVRATLATGEGVTAGALIGADGLHSRVRAALDGVERLPAPVYAGMTCWRGLFEAPRGSLSAEGLTWQEMWGRGRRFGWFHVGGERHGFYAFLGAPAGLADDVPGARRQRLTELFGDFGPPVGRVLETLDDDAIHRDDIFDRPPRVLPWGRGVVTLIGDAAHPVQPSIGQGACMGVEDAWELAQALDGVEPGDLPGALREFEARRAPRTAKVHRVSRQVTALGQASGRVSASLRDALYRATPTWLGDLQFRWLFDYRPS